MHHTMKMTIMASKSTSVIPQHLQMRCNNNSTNHSISSCYNSRRRPGTQAAAAVQNTAATNAPAAAHLAMRCTIARCVFFESL
jgi:hypothetical protein